MAAGTVDTAEALRLTLGGVYQTVTGTMFILHVYLWNRSCTDCSMYTGCFGFRRGGALGNEFDLMTGNRIERKSDRKTLAVDGCRRQTNTGS